MSEFLSNNLPYLLSGISVGGQYALIAIGYTMVYGILRLINFAHGDVFMVAGLIMVYATASLPIYVSSYFLCHLEHLHYENVVGRSGGPLLPRLRGWFRRVRWIRSGPDPVLPGFPGRTWTRPPEPFGAPCRFPPRYRGKTPARRR